MTRELTGSEQARRAGLWDGVRPEALVPRERDPVSGSLSGRTDSDGGGKDRRTESTRAEASTSTALRPGMPKGRWLAAAAAGIAALVIGVGGAVALANRGFDDPGTTRTGATGPGASPVGPSGSVNPTGMPTAPPADQERSYTGSLTATSEEGSISSTETIGVFCSATECNLTGWSISGRRLTWGPGESVVSRTLPQVGEVADMCESMSDFSPEAVWAVTVADDAMSFRFSHDEATTPCGPNSTMMIGAAVYEFDGVRTR